MRIVGDVRVERQVSKGQVQCCLTLCILLPFGMQNRLEMQAVHHHRCAGSSRLGHQERID